VRHERWQHLQHGRHLEAAAFGRMRLRNPARIVNQLLV
jgi:hypothetical protein